MSDKTVTPGTDGTPYAPTETGGGGLCAELRQQYEASSVQAVRDALVWAHDKALTYEARHSALRERLERAESSTDGRCYYCGEQTNTLIGDPSMWAMRFCHADDPGVVKYHHTGCVTERLKRLERAEEALRQVLAVRGYMDRGQENYLMREIAEAYFKSLEPQEGEGRPTTCKRCGQPVIVGEYCRTCDQEDLDDMIRQTTAPVPP